MPKVRTITQLCNDLYDDDDIKSAVMEDAKKAGTTERIESGELNLPGPQDAFHWHRRITGQTDIAEETHRQIRRIAELEKAVASLSDPNRPPSSDYTQQLEARLAALEGKHS